MGQEGRRASGERGQVVPLLSVVVLVVVVGLLLVGEVAGAVVDRARARTAADAAALAGVLVDEAEAESVAEGNGGVLESFVAVGDEVEVVVRVGEARASARAREVHEPIGTGSQHAERIG